MPLALFMQITQLQNLEDLTVNGCLLSASEIKIEHRISHKMKSISFRGCSYNDSLIIFMQSLKRMPNLSKLNVSVSFFDFGADGAKIVAEGLRNAPKLAVLDLSSNSKLAA